MSSTHLYRLAGLAGLAAGLLNLLVEVLPASLGLPLDLLVNCLGLWVLAALYLRQRVPTGLLGLVAYAVKSLGLALSIGFLFAQAFVLSQLGVEQTVAVLAGPAGLAAIVALALLTLGAVLFGIATLRAGIFPRWAAFLMMAGFILVPVAAVAAPDIVKTIGEVVLSAGLIGLSVHLYATAANPSN